MIIEQDFTRWPVTDGKRPTRADQWQKHHAHVAEVNRKQRAERRAAKAAEAEQKRQQWHAEREEKQRVKALKAYQLAGGNEADFDAVWADIRAQQLQDKAQEAVAPVVKPQRSVVRF